ncbi:peptidoglycan bridge formation glycyltransferase FemA/FemB family protein [Candidatus Saccharibacteria bacterium]|nr:peptidoglycan bridge formation glycyltransferase FemA/FemB family protein [Candidatus Saccharibacteria bacterium]
MTVRFATHQEITDWNHHIIANPDGGNVFASYEFAMQKETGGYKARFVFIGDQAVTILEKNAPFIGKLWYLPKGPGITSTKELWVILKALKPLAKKRGVFAIRIEPELRREQQQTLTRHGLIKAMPIIPNPSTITLDISEKLETILTNLPQKGRYAIKRAERDGVTTKLVKTTEKNCQIMFELFKATAEGQFDIRSYAYYRSFWQRFEAAGSGQLFFAYVDGKVVAGAYAMVYGKKSTYKDGASVRKRTTYGASHLLQWRVIQWAKSKGSLLHDFCGSPPSDELNNSEHRHHGIGLFKTAFNRTVTDYVGCYDFVIWPAQYKIWTKIGERVARRLHYYKHHDSYY